MSKFKRRKIKTEREAKRNRRCLTCGENSKLTKFGYCARCQPREDNLPSVIAFSTGLKKQL